MINEQSISVQYFDFAQYGAFYNSTIISLIILIATLAHYSHYSYWHIGILVSLSTLFHYICHFNYIVRKSKENCTKIRYMHGVLAKIGSKIRQFIEFFYPPFQRFFPKEFFRYGVVGTFNVVFDWVLYFVAFHFILKKEMLHLGFITLSPHIAALALSFPISFLTGFLLQKYVTFTLSTLKGKVQMVRYGIVVILNLLINYFGLKLFVDIVGWFPTPSKMLITLVTVLISFLLQKKFTFK